MGSITRLNEVAARYALFDMVPLGNTKLSPKRQAMNMARDALEKGWLSRPSDFNAHFKHMCSVHGEDWSWFATDVLAIHRDLVTPQMLHELKFITSTVLAEFSPFLANKCRRN